MALDVDINKPAEWVDKFPAHLDVAKFLVKGDPMIYLERRAHRLVE